MKKRGTNIHRMITKVLSLLLAVVLLSGSMPVYAVGEEGNMTTSQEQCSCDVLCTDLAKCPVCEHDIAACKGMSDEGISPAEPEVSDEPTKEPEVNDEQTKEPQINPTDEPAAEPTEQSIPEPSVAGRAAVADNAFEVSDGYSTPQEVSTLSEAIRVINDAKFKDEKAYIKLMKDTTYDSNDELIVYNKNLTLDLNGHTLNMASPWVDRRSLRFANTTSEDSLSVTIKDSGGGSGKIFTKGTSMYGLIDVSNDYIISIEGGTIETASGAAIDFYGAREGQLKISGGKIIGSQTTDPKAESFLVRVDKGSFQMTGGEITAKNYKMAVYLDSASDSTISDGSIKHIGPYDLTDTTTKTPTQMAVKLTGGYTTLEISGGTLSGAYGIAMDKVSEVEISGTPSIKGEVADIRRTNDTILRDVGYTGDAIGLYCHYAEQERYVVLVNNVQSQESADRYKLVNPFANYVESYMLVWDQKASTVKIDKMPAGLYEARWTTDKAKSFTYGTFADGLAYMKENSKSSEGSETGYKFQLHILKDVTIASPITLSDKPSTKYQIEFYTSFGYKQLKLAEGVGLKITSGMVDIDDSQGKNTYNAYTYRYPIVGNSTNPLITVSDSGSLWYGAMGLDNPGGPGIEHNSSGKVTYGVPLMERTLKSFKAKDEGIIVTGNGTLVLTSYGQIISTEKAAIKITNKDAKLNLTQNFTVKGAMGDIQICAPGQVDATRYGVLSSSYPIKPIVFYCNWDVFPSGATLVKNITIPEVIDTFTAKYYDESLKEYTDLNILKPTNVTEDNPGNITLGTNQIFSGLKMLTPPTKTAYRIGEYFNLTGSTWQYTLNGETKVQTDTDGFSWKKEKLTGKETCVEVSLTKGKKTLSAEVPISFPPLVRVSFDTDGGTPQPPDQELLPGEKVVEPLQKPEKQGHRLNGWMNGDKFFQFDTIVNEDLVLKAAWQDITAPTDVTVMYKKDGAWVDIGTSDVLDLIFKDSVELKFSANHPKGIKKFYYVVNKYEKAVDAIDNTASITLDSAFTGTISVTAVGNNGNLSVPPITTRPIMVDTSKDWTAKYTIDKGGYVSDTWAKEVTFSLSGAQAESGIQKYQYKIDGGDWTDMTATETESATATAPENVKKASATINTNGTYNCVFRALSNSGNTGGESAPIAVKIDNVDPVVDVKGIADSSLDSDNITLEIQVGPSGIKKVEVSKNDGKFEDITNTYKDGYVATENKKYTFRVTTNAGYKGESHITYSNLGKKLPVVSIDSGDYTEGTWETTLKNIILKPSADVEGCTFEYRTSKTGDWQSYNAPIEISQDVNTTYGFRATAPNGNVSAVKSIVIKRDTTAPTGKIFFNGTDVTQAVDDTVTFNLFYSTIDGTKVINELQDNISLSRDITCKYILVKDGTTKTLAELEAATEWKDGSELAGGFEYLHHGTKVILYVQIADLAGNTVYLSSNGAQIDIISPKIVPDNSGVTNYATQIIKITDDSLKLVTLDGIDIDARETDESCIVTLAGNQDKSYMLEMTDKAGNVNIVTYTMKTIASLATADFNALTGDNVTVDNKKAIEAIANNIKDKVTPTLVSATPEEKAEIKVITDKADALLTKIEDVETEISRISDAVGSYNIDTVQESDLSALLQLKADLSVLTVGNNITDPRREELAKLDETLETLIIKVDPAAGELKRIIAAVNTYNSDTVTLSDKDDLTTLQGEAKALSDSGKLTGEKVVLLQKAEEKITVLLNKIADTQTEQERIINEIGVYKADTVTLGEKEAIQKLVVDVESLLATKNLTDEQKEALGKAKSTAEALLKTIGDNNTEFNRVIAEVAKYSEATVKSDDEKAVEQLKKDAAALVVKEKNLTQKQVEDLKGAAVKVDALLKKLADVSAEHTRILNAVDEYSKNGVLTSDKEGLESLKTAAQLLLDGGNLSSDQREKLKPAVGTINLVLEELLKIKTEYDRIVSEAAKYKEATVTGDNKTAITKLVDACNTLLQKNSLIDAEQTTIKNIVLSANSLIKKIDDVKTKTDAIVADIGQYEEKTVKSTDEAAIKKLKSDTAALITTENLTKKQREDLVAAAAKIEKLLAKIQETNTARETIISEIVKYDVNTVTAANKNALGKLKAENDKLLAGKNLTDAERNILTDAAKKIAELLNKIDKLAADKAIVDAEKFQSDTVNSGNKDELEKIKEDLKKLLESENLKEDEKLPLKEAEKEVVELLGKIKETDDEIDRITGNVSAITDEIVKSTDKNNLEKLKEDIELLTKGKNLTDAEREEIKKTKDSIDDLLGKIADIKTESDRITDAAGTFDLGEVNSDNKGTLEDLKKAANQLIAGNNLTGEEKKPLQDTVDTIDSLLNKIAQTQKEFTRITEQVGKITEDNVTSTDRDNLVKLKEDIKKLIGGENVEKLRSNIKKLTGGKNLTVSESDALKKLDKKLDVLIKIIDEAAKESDRITNSVKLLDNKDKITSVDKSALDILKNAAQSLLESKNLTDAEKEPIREANKTIDKLLKIIDDTKQEIGRITETIGKITEDNVIAANKADLDKLKEDIKKLTDGENLTLSEREALEAFDKKIDTLLKKIADTKAENNRITSAVSRYDDSMVKSGDKADLEKLTLDAKKLIAGGNLTEAEKKPLQDAVQVIEELLKKIADTAAEIGRITDAVEGMDENTVKSSDKAGLDKLKEDIKKLTDSKNLIEAEIEALNKLDKQLDSLLKKIEAIQTRSRNILDALVGYDIVTVTSNDKAAIEKLKEDAKSLIDGDNLSEDEKNPLITASAEIGKLLEKIYAVEAEKDRITNAVNEFKMETVKSTDKATLETLKANSDTLIGSGDLTDKQKEELSETSSNIDKLIEQVENAEKAMNSDVKIPASGEVQLSDKESLTDTKKEIEKVLENYGGNYTEDEMATVKEKLDRVDKAIETIVSVEKVVEAINKLPNPDKVKLENTDVIQKTKELYDSLTEHQKSLITQDTTEKLKKTGTALANLLLKDESTGGTVESVGETILDPQTKLAMTVVKPTDKQKESVKLVAKNAEILSLYEINLLLKGAIIQPNGMVKVTLTLTDNQMKNFKDFNIVYIDAEGNASVLKSTVAGNKISFETDHFSSYGIIGTPISSGSESSKPTGSESSKPKGSVNTGDNSNTVPPIAGMFISAGLLAALMLVRAKNKKRKS